jgi:hypothetical protein
LNIFKRRNYVFAAFTIFGIIMAVFFALEQLRSDINNWILSAVIFAASVISAGFWMQEYKKLKSAQLILENSFLRFYTSITSNISDNEEKSDNAESVEVFISYFGILSGEKIITFNQNGIWLKDVEISQNFISLSYGTEKKMQSTWLVRPPIDSVKLDDIVEKFRYETGIEPRILY